MILFVGDRPSPKMKSGAKPFEGAACEKRLKEWIKTLGVSEYRIKNSTDVGIYMSALITHNTGYPVICLGNNASNRLNSVPHFKLPHPSYRNRKLNDKNYEKQVLQECKDWLDNF